MKKLLAILLAAGYMGVAHADNPLVTTMYTADPTARVIDGKLFVFPSTDINQQPGEKNWFCMPYYHIFSTTNLMDWHDYGRQIDQNDVPWGEPNANAMWAPDCIEKDGKFYFYFPDRLKGAEGGHTIGVAIADHAEGPYTVLDQPIKGMDGIDPGVFIDDDGSAYIYWSAKDNVYGSRLKDNMIELEGETVLMEGLPREYKEAPFMFKRNGIYYLTYAHKTPIKNCDLAYSTSTSPLEGFEYRGAFLDRWDKCWTIHHSFVEYNGDWILFYHHNDINPANDKRRSIRADYVTFAKDGRINKVKATLRGIGLCDADRKIQVDRYSEIGDNTAISRTSEGFPANWQVEASGKKSWISYNNVDFKDIKYKKVKIRYSAEKAGSTLSIRNNGFLGTDIAVAELKSTKGKYKEVTFDLSSNPHGVVDLYLMFEAEGNNVKVDWIQFIK